MAINTSCKSEKKWAFLFWLLVALQIVPVWLFDFFPSVDGPSHIENAWILKQLLFEAASSDARFSFQEYYQINSRLIANWPSHLMLAFLMEFASPASAEKILVTGYILLFAMSYRLLIRNLIPVHASQAAIVGIPLISNLFINFGFYNFCLAIVVMFWIIAQWATLNLLTRLSALKISFALLLLLLLHPFIYAATVMAVAVLAFPIHKKKHPSAFKQNVIYALFPSLVVFCLWLVTKSADPENGTNIPALSSRIIDIAILKSLLGPTWNGIYLTTAFFGSLFVLAVVIIYKKFFSQTFASTFAAISLFFYLLSVFAPYGLAGGFFFGERFTLLGTLFLILTITISIKNFHEQGIIKNIFTGIGVSMALATSVLRIYEYKDINVLIGDFILSADSIPKGSSVRLSQFPDTTRHYTFSILDHTIGYLVPSHKFINLQNYEALSKDFPLRFKPELIGPANIQAEYMITLNYESYTHDNPALNAIAESLNAHYKKTSGPSLYGVSVFKLASSTEK